MDLVPYREQMTGLWNDADNTKQLIVQHTTESDGGNTAVIGFLEDTRRGSYQTMIDYDGEEVRMVPDNRQAWGAGPQGNMRGLHVCAMGRAAYSRQRWLSEEKLIERTAMRYAQWSRQYGIPLVKLTADQVHAGKRGVCGHTDISDAWGEVDHTDPGPGFPYDAVIGRAKVILGQKNSQGGNAVADNDVQAITRYLTDFVTGFVGPIGSDVKDIREQLTGGRDGGQYPGWPQLDGKTVVDAFAAFDDRLAGLEAQLVAVEKQLASVLAVLRPGGGRDE